jgi:hypothetical protein
MSPVFPRSAPLRRLGTAAFMIVALATAACGGGGGSDFSTGPGPGRETPAGGIVGVYQLASVDGNPLIMPWETDGAFANYFDGGHIELKGDGTFVRSIRGRTVIPRTQDIVYNERWSGTYTFEPSAPGEVNGKVMRHTSGGDADEMDVTQISITVVNSVPGAIGPQDIILVYVRD